MSDNILSNLNLADSLAASANTPTGGSTMMPENNPAVQQYTAPATLQAAQERGSTVGEHLSFAVPGAVLGAIDTFGTSLRLLSPESVSNWVQGSSFGNYYTQNKDALQTAGDLAGMFLPGTVFKNAVQAGSWLHRAVTFGTEMGAFDGAAAIAARKGIMAAPELFSKDRFIQSIFTSGADTGELMQGISARASYQASRTGAFDFATDANNPEWRALISDASRMKMADAFKEQVAWEFGVATTMNSSETLYPSDWSLVNYMTLGALPIGAAVGIESLFLKRQIAKVAESAGEFGYKMRMQNTDALLNISRPGTRDLQLSMWGERLDAAKKALAADPDNKVLQASMSSWQGAINKQFVDDTRALGTDNLFPGLTSRTELSEAHIATMKDTVQADKFSSLGLISLEPIPEGDTAGGYFVTTRKAKLAALDEKHVKASLEANNAFPDTVKAVTAIEDQIEQVQKLSPIVFEPGGIKVSAISRSPIAQDTLTKTADVRSVVGDVMSGTNFTIDAASAGFMKIGRDNLEVTLPFTDELLAANTQGQVFFGGHNITAFAKSTATFDYTLKQEARAATERLKTPFADNLALNTQSLEDRGRLQLVTETALDSIVAKAKTGGLPAQVLLDPRQNALMADAASELYSRLGPQQFAQTVKLPAGVATKDLPLMQLYHKMQDYNTWRTMRSGVALGVLPAELDMSLTDFAHYVNLPQSAPGEMHPVIQAFESLYGQGEKQLSDSFRDITSFKTFMQENTFAPELTGYLGSDIPLDGGMLHYGADGKKAVMGIYRQLPDDVLRNEDALLQLKTLERAGQINKMATANQRGAILGKAVFDMLHTNPIAETAADIKTLGNGSQRGFDAVTQRSFAGGDSGAFQALDILKDQTTRQTNELIKTMFKNSEFEDIAGRLLAPGNEAELENLGHYLFLRQQGWDVAPQALHYNAKGVPEKVKFALVDTPRTRQLWRTIYGEEMPMVEGQITHMPAPTSAFSGKAPVYKAFELQGYAIDMAYSVDRLAKQLYSEVNHIKDLAGKGPTVNRPFWVPALNMNTPYMTNIRDQISHENYVTLAARSPQQLQAKVEAQLDAYAAKGMKVYPEDQRTLATELGARDEALTRLIDYSDPLAQNTGITGKQVGFGAIPDARDALSDLKDSLEGGFSSVTRRNTAMYFEPHINTVKMLNDSLNRTVDRAGELTMPQRWLNVMFDNPTLNPNSQMGKVYGGAAGMMDQALQYLQKKMYPNVSEALTVTPHAQATFAKAKSMFGDAYPFRDAFDRLQQTTKVPDPWTARGMFHGLNQLTTTLTLRLLELGQPLIHMTSLGSTMPAVINALVRPSEMDIAGAWESRISTFARAITPGGSDAVFSPARLMASAAHDYWNATEMVGGKEVSVFEHARSMGMLDHSTAEYARPLIELEAGMTKQKLNAAIDLLSKPTDWSYYASKGMAFMGGRRIAIDGYQMTDARSIYAFALKFANDTVGDYRSINKPQIFQGAVGTPLGLFTTFGWNYAQRVFKYIENKDTRALATQFGTQAMLFGGQSLPGWNAFVNHFATNYDGSSNPVTGMRSHFGDDATDWFLYGTISNLPKLLNLLPGVSGADGISLFTRAEGGIRGVPTLLSPDEAPGVRAVTSLYQGVDAALQGMRDNGVQPLQIAQNLAQYSMSRPFRNFVDMLSGSSLDTKGRIVDDAVLTPMGIAARLLALKPMQTEKNLEAWSMINASKTAREQKMSDLEDTVRYNLRNGRYDGEAGGQRLVDTFVSAYKNGLDPSSFAEFMRNNYLAATVDRNTLMMLEKMSSMSRTPAGMADMKKLWWSAAKPNNGNYETGGSR